MHKPYSESNSFAYGNLNSRLFLLQKGYCFLQLRQGLTAKMSEETCALGNVTECSPILLLLKTQSPLTVQC